MCVLNLWKLRFTLFFCIKKYKVMHEQGAFKEMPCVVGDLTVTTELSKRVLALPMHSYMEKEEQDMVIKAVREYCRV